MFTFDGDAAGQKAALHAFGLDSAFLSQTFVAVADDNLDRATAPSSEASEQCAR